MNTQLISGALCLAAASMFSCSSNNGSSETSAADTTQTEASNSEYVDITAPEHWKNYNQDTISSNWTYQNGILTLEPGGGDIVTKEQYQNFDLEIEWKISEGGNSGLFFNVVENDTLGAVYYSGPEYQFIDDERHADAKNRKHRSGDNYDVQQATKETVKPAGEWNLTRLVVNNGKVEHYLNGEKIVEYELGSQAWQDSVANSKFAQMPAYAKADSGHLALQDHGDPISFRNIRIKEL